jgi:hypothetical protein
MSTTTYINTVKNAIDVPLMDVKNISNLILGYIEKKIYKFKFYTSRGKYDYYKFNAVILAESPKHCWKEWKKMLKIVSACPSYHNSSIRWRLKKKDFLDNLTLASDKLYYSERKVKYAYIEEYEDGCILDYKRPTKKVIKKDQLEEYNPFREGKMIKNNITGEYNRYIKDKDGIDEHDFRMFPFDGVDLMFDEKKKALYYKDFISGKYTIGCVTHAGTHCNPVYI